MSFKVVIPARLVSTRLPRKVLLDLAGKPVVRHVWEAARASGAEQIIIATDHEEVAAACRAFGAEVLLTAASHPSGTDRIGEVAASLAWSDATVVVNVQGDEPLMPPQAIAQAAQLLRDDTGAQIATLAHPLHRLDDWCNPNVVKLVRDQQGRALYFSRAPIPWQRDGASRAAPVLPDGALRHIGLYAYRVAALHRFCGLAPSALEQIEALEQLRALTHGIPIAVGISQTPPPRGVDTAEDLAALTALLARA